MKTAITQNTYDEASRLVEKIKRNRLQSGWSFYVPPVDMEDM
jgi:hypothetical protein